MARIFISYSRADRLFVNELVPLLNEVFPDHQIWYDKHISGGEDWWQRILREIHACDLFIYLLSNDSLESDYCRDEFNKALRLQKPCLPVIVRFKTEISRADPKIEPEIRRRQIVDMSGGFGDHHNNAKLYAAIRKLLDGVPATSPLWNGPKSYTSPYSRTRHNRLTTGLVPILVAIVSLVGLAGVMIIMGILVLVGNKLINLTPPPSPTMASLLGSPGLSFTETFMEQSTPNSFGTDQARIALDIDVTQTVAGTLTARWSPPTLTPTATISLTPTQPVATATPLPLLRATTLPPVDLDQAIQISYGAVATGIVNSNQLAMYYRFEGQAGDVVRITAEAIDGSLDTMLFFWDANANLVATNDDDRNTTNSAIQITLHSTGAYFIAVSRYDGLGGFTDGEFRMTLAKLN